MKLGRDEIRTAGRAMIIMAFAMIGSIVLMFIGIPLTVIFTN